MVSPLRILAHPLRSRMLAELRTHGGATASDLARVLDTHTGATSYHLRKMAEAGLIEDTGTGGGRRRVWHAVAEAGQRAAVDAEPLDADDAGAARWLALDYVAHFSDRAGAWVGEREQWPPGWEAAGLEDHLVLVEAEQLTALRAELVEVLIRYRRVGQGSPQAKRVVVYTCALPVDPPPRVAGPVSASGARTGRPTDEPRAAPRG